MTKMHDIMWLDSTDSTNNEARRRFSELDNLSVLSALTQTAGRGQKGNRWFSKPGENLTFSIVLKFGTGSVKDGIRAAEDKESGICSNGLFPAMEAAEQFTIIEVAALAVIDLLHSHGIDAKVKWPNDIYAGDRKICGMLIENAVMDGRLASSIVGIGINVNQTEFSPDLPNPTSMQKENPGTYDIRKLLEEFMDIFASGCRRCFIGKEAKESLRNRYLETMWRIGESSRFADYTTQPSGHLDGPSNILKDSAGPADVFTGIIRGISDLGLLMVETSDGILRTFSFKEIGYIL